MGASGNEVSALETALNKEGLGSFTEAIYGDALASAVSGFQEKYRSDILTPNGLSYGTGYVGVSTRAKLNSLYGCSSTTAAASATTTQSSPSITVLSPGAGWNWQIGNTYNIEWSVNNVNWQSGSPQLGIYLSATDEFGGNYNYYTITSDAPSKNSYLWQIPSNIKPGTYSIRVVANPNDKSNSFAGYSGQFTIVAAAPIITPQPPLVATTTATSSALASGSVNLLINGSINPSPINLNDTFNVSWSATNYQYCVGLGDNMPLVTGDSWLNKNLPNSGTKYLVAQDLGMVSGYKNPLIVEIRCYASPSNYSDGQAEVSVNLFKTSASWVNVTNPTGGDYAPGQSMNIKWQSVGNASGKVNIQYWYLDPLTARTSGSVAIGVPDTGSYNWVIPSNQSAKINYQISVLQYGTNVMSWSNFFNTDSAFGHANRTSGLVNVLESLQGALSQLKLSL